MIRFSALLAACAWLLSTAPRPGMAQDAGSPSSRPRARALGVAPGILPTGRWNAITDVAGVRVGHVTRIEAPDVRTGATAILAHGGNLFQDKVPAAVVVGNGYGKLMGSTQVAELGEIETPIVLTNTLSVPQGAEAVLDWTLGLPGNEDVRSVNAVVGETNDGYLNDIRARNLRADTILPAIVEADTGFVPEGAVGAGTGTVCYGWKGGIGTSSRRLPASLGGYTVGVLVQANFGGVLQILGIPVGVELGVYFLREEVEIDAGDGSVIVVVATDAPLSDRNLRRLATRALLGIGRTGSPMTNGSGDYVIAFSTAEEVRRTVERRRGPSLILDLPNEALSPLFQSVVEATEEAVYNALFAGVTMTGRAGNRVEALPVERVIDILKNHNALDSATAR